jgi:hypothetical protein
MTVSLAIIGSRTVFPSIGEIDIEIMKLPLPWDNQGEGPEAFARVIHEVIDGMADGGDYAGRLWAEARDIPVHEEPITGADIEKYGKYLAPKARNSRIAERCGMALAWWDRKSNGTTDCVARLVMRGKPVVVVSTKAAPDRPRRPRT